VLYVDRFHEVVISYIMSYCVISQRHDRVANVNDFSSKGDKKVLLKIKAKQLTLMT